MRLFGRALRWGLPPVLHTSKLETLEVSTCQKRKRTVRMMIDSKQQL